MKIIFHKLSCMRLLPCSVMGLATCFAISSCSTDNIDPWQQEQSYVWFTDTIMNFTNMSQPDVPIGDDLTIEVPMSFAGKTADRDRTIAIEVVKAPSDPRTQIDIQPGILPAGQTEGTLKIKLKNSSHLDTVYDTLQVKVGTTTDFAPGLPKYQQFTLCMHNGYVKPSWWTKRAENSIGYFTQLKMQIYMKVKGDDKDPRDNQSSSLWSSSDLGLQYWVFMLNDYIEQNNIVYPEGDEHAGKKPQFARRKY